MRELTLASETLFAGRLLQLRRDTVQLPNGRTSVREVVVHPGAVGVVPVLPDGRVLLVRQFRYAAGQPLLEIPAGTLHPGENPSACAQRELREETNYTAGRLELMASLYLAPGYSTELLHLFWATELAPAAGACDEDEVLELVPMALNDAIAAIERGDIQDAKSVAGLLLVWRKLMGSG